MSPTEALEYAITIPCNAARRPGAAVQRLPARVREALKELTSDDAKKMRGDDYYIPPSGREMLLTAALSKG